MLKIQFINSLWKGSYAPAHCSHRVSRIFSALFRVPKLTAPFTHAKRLGWKGNMKAKQNQAYRSEKPFEMLSKNMTWLTVFKKNSGWRNSSKGWVPGLQTGDPGPIAVPPYLLNPTSAPERALHGSWAEPGGVKAESKSQEWPPEPVCVVQRSLFPQSKKSQGWMNHRLKIRSGGSPKWESAALIYTGVVDVEVDGSRVQFVNQNYHCQDIKHGWSGEIEGTLRFQAWVLRCWWWEYSEMAFPQDRTRTLIRRIGATNSLHRFIHTHTVRRTCTI